MPSPNRLASGMSYGRTALYTNVPLGYCSSYSILGNETSAAQGQIYYSQIWVPNDITATFMGYISGSTTAGKVTMGLWDQNGSLLGCAALTGTVPTAANMFVTLAFTSNIFLPGPSL